VTKECVRSEASDAFGVAVRVSGIGCVLRVVDHLIVSPHESFDFRMAALL
jgi:hypothetical protein